MNGWKRGMAALCAGVLCLTTASAHSHPWSVAPEPPAVSPWAQAEVDRALELGLEPSYDVVDYRQPITRAQFCEIALEYVAIQAHCKDSDEQGDSLGALVPEYMGEWDEEYPWVKEVFPDGDRAVSVAYYLGLVEGRGDGTFDPEGLITRQEAAAMLTRAYTVCGGVLPEETGAAAFPDGAEIAPWARESAAALAGWGVMNGREDGRFDPAGHYSVEQCLLTFLRLYENGPVSRKNGNVPPLFSYDQCMAYLDKKARELEEVGYGTYEKLRVEGPAATFVLHVNGAGFMHTSAAPYLVYRDGGMVKLDMGVCNVEGTLMLSGSTDVQNCRFSEDGRTFFCDILLTRDIGGPGEVLSHEKGLYHITIDVDTCRYQTQREDLT